LRGKDDASGFGPEKVVSRAQNQELASATVAAIMKADVHQLPAYVGQQLPNQDYAIFRISKVQQPPHPDTARRQSEQQQIADVLAQQEMAAYLAVLKHKAEVEFSKPKAAEAAADSEPAAGS
jgi:peptidyl-prolyl cis-trans isomerase D